MKAHKPMGIIHLLFCSGILSKPRLQGHDICPRNISVGKPYLSTMAYNPILFKCLDRLGLGKIGTFGFKTNVFTPRKVARLRFNTDGKVVSINEILNALNVINKRNRHP